jgi:hypothetical protein
MMKSASKFVFGFAESSSIDLQLIAAVSHDAIISWYVTHICLTLLILILFLSPSTVPFVSLQLDILRCAVCMYPM